MFQIKHCFWENVIYIFMVFFNIDNILLTRMSCIPNFKNGTMEYDKNNRILIQHIDNSKVIFHSAAVTWLKYCRDGVKLYSINQLINQSFMKHLES